MTRKKSHSKNTKSAAKETTGRDPASGKFERGHSGNPAGRPAKAKTVDAAIARAFAEKAPVRVNGKQQKIPKLDIAAAQIANRSAAGDPRLVKLGFELARKAEENKAQAAQMPARLIESDQQIADRLFARWRKIIEEASNEQNDH